MCLCAKFELCVSKVGWVWKTMKVAAETLAEKTVIKLRKVKRFFLLTERFFSAQKQQKLVSKKGGGNISYKLISDGQDFDHH